MKQNLKQAAQRLNDAGADHGADELLVELRQHASRAALQVEPKTGGHWGVLAYRFRHGGCVVGWWYPESRLLIVYDQRHDGIGDARTACNVVLGTLALLAGRRAERDETTGRRGQREAGKRLPRKTPPRPGKQARAASV
jgi:hypothetical protein